MFRLTPLLLTVTLLLPSVLGLLVTGASLSAGIVLCSVMWTCAGLATRRPRYTFPRTTSSYLAFVIAVICALAIHLGIAYFFVRDVDLGRSAISFVILFIESVGALLAADRLVHVDERIPIHAAQVACLFLMLTGAAAIAGVPAVGPTPNGKGVIFFPEPSHYALAILPVLLVSVSMARRPTQFAAITVALLIAAALQNLTMVVGILTIGAVLLRGTASALLALAVAGAAVMLDITYYSSRLDFSSDSTNLSTLVYLQGWENALLNFGETDGWGIGFQQFGVAGSKGDISEKIASLLQGEYINLLDGGSNATKVIGEFGVTGILMLLAYVVAASRSVRFIRGQQRLPRRLRDRRALFFHSLIVTYLFEIFVRGVGYFTAGGFLTLTAFMGLAMNRAAQFVEDRAEPAGQAGQRSAQAPR